MNKDNKAPFDPFARRVEEPKQEIDPVAKKEEGRSSATDSRRRNNFVSTNVKSDIIDLLRAVQTIIAMRDGKRIPIHELMRSLILSGLKKDYPEVLAAITSLQQDIKAK